MSTVGDGPENAADPAEPGNGGMWYPEEPVTYCRRCDADIPVDCYWRGKGVLVSGSGGRTRTVVLYSQCPDCGDRASVGLSGPWWYRVLYGWLWRLRYPAVRPPELDLPAAELRRRQ